MIIIEILLLKLLCWVWNALWWLRLSIFHCRSKHWETLSLLLWGASPELHNYLHSWLKRSRQFVTQLQPMMMVIILYCVRVYIHTYIHTYEAAFPSAHLWLPHGGCMGCCNKFGKVLVLVIVIWSMSYETLFFLLLLLFVIKIPFESAYSPLYPSVH